MATHYAMTRILIPRSDAVSAKPIVASDTEKLFGHLGNFVCSGMVVAAQCPNVLAVDVSTGITRLNGLWLCSDATEAIVCLTACMTNYIFTQINRDACCEPCNFTIVTSTCCMAGADQFTIGNAVTDCTTVTGVCNFRASVSTSGSPTGSITMFGGTISTVPIGWLLADGMCRSKVTCANLFAVIGAQFGCCGCCFTLPNLIENFPRGAPACCEPGGTGGADTHTITSAQTGNVNHTHTYTRNNNCNGANGGVVDVNPATVNTGGTATQNAASSHNNMPSFLEVLYIIKT